MKKLTPTEIIKLKVLRKITKATTLDYFSAKAVEESGVHIIGLFYLKRIFYVQNYKF